MGAPVGNKNAKRAAKWRDALERALSAKDLEGEGSTLFKIATRVIDAALAGDPAAIQEIANRLDGKPSQSVTVAGDEDAPPIRLGVIELVRPG